MKVSHGFLLYLGVHDKCSKGNIKTLLTIQGVEDAAEDLGELQIRPIEVPKESRLTHAALTNLMDAQPDRIHFSLGEVEKQAKGKR